jgi:ferredoxin
VWPPAKAPKSPCPTLKAISFVTALLDKREEWWRRITTPPAPTPSYPSARWAAPVFTSPHLQTAIEFTPANKWVLADVGTPLADVAQQTGVHIPFKCKKGECGTCEVRVDGKWTRACQTTVPPVGRGEVLRVRVPPASATAAAKPPSAFFSPKSILEGVVNNGLGVRVHVLAVSAQYLLIQLVAMCCQTAGFISRAWAVDAEFHRRMDKERLLQAKLAARKAELQ